MKVDLKQVEEAAKELYIRALKILPPDIKQGFERLDRGEHSAHVWFSDLGYEYVRINAEYTT